MWADGIAIFHHAFVAYVLREKSRFFHRRNAQNDTPLRRHQIMAKKAKAVPRGYRTVTPYLIIKDAASAIDYYKQAFKAKVLMCLSEPNGKVGHDEIKIGDSRIMLADEYPETGSRGPQSFGGSPVSILLYVEDCDDIFNRAIARGGKIVKPMSDQFYGDRAGTLEDPFGHTWTIATHKEDLTSEEILQRAAGRSD